MRLSLTASPPSAPKQTCSSCPNTSSSTTKLTVNARRRLASLVAADTAVSRAAAARCPAAQCPPPPPRPAACAVPAASSARAACEPRGKGGDAGAAAVSARAPLSKRVPARARAQTHCFLYALVVKCVASAAAFSKWRLRQRAARVSVRPPQAAHKHANDPRTPSRCSKTGPCPAGPRPLAPACSARAAAA